LREADGEAALGVVGCDHINQPIGDRAAGAVLADRLSTDRFVLIGFA
jgi:hypothetical protein